MSTITRIGYQCPSCKSDNWIPYDDCSGVECAICGEFVKDKELDKYLKQHPENILLKRVMG